MRAVVYEHEELEGPALLGPALESRGFVLERRFRHARPDDVSADLVVAMGGPMGAYEASRHPFLFDELSVMRARLAQGRPVLGICLGAQLLAASAGARVYPGESGFELGVFPVALTNEATVDPVFSSMPPSFDVAHWHGDTFDEVPGAVRLAGTSRYPQQAFRLGDSYGLQFHPELDAAAFARWLEQCPEDLRRAGRSLDEVRAHDVSRLAQSRPLLERLLDALASHFAGVGRARSR